MALQQNFKALIVSETAAEAICQGDQAKDPSELPANEVLIEVKYSSLNYKDALSATGNKGVTSELSSHARNRCGRSGRGKLEPGIRRGR